MLDASRGTMGLHLSARAVLKTPASVARIDQRLRRIDPNMPDTITPYREIPLTKGKVALVDAADYDLVSQYRWHAFKNASGEWYARSTSLARKEGKSLWMHRLILNCPPDKKVDHKDHDGLNNRRYNLRPATNAQNIYNMRIKRNNTSGYKGVVIHSAHGRRTGKWRAVIKHNNKTICLGEYRDPKDAALAYDAKAKELFGEFAFLNFPQGAIDGQR